MPANGSVRPYEFIPDVIEDEVLCLPGPAIRRSTELLINHVEGRLIADERPLRSPSPRR